MAEPDIEAARKDKAAEVVVQEPEKGPENIEAQILAALQRMEKDSTNSDKQIVTPAFALTFLFGYFSIVGLIAAGAANDQSQIANQLALVSICASNLTSSFCEDLLKQGDLYLPNIANKLYKLSPASGKGREQPIARAPESGTVNYTNIVSPVKSSAGSDTINLFVILFFITIGFCFCWVLVRVWGRFNAVKKPGDRSIASFLSWIHKGALRSVYLMEPEKM